MKLIIAIAATSMVFASALLPADPAVAASGDVEVSPDGVAFTSTYPGTLFNGIARFVPGDADQQTFYVRNGGSEPGHLRITLKDVVAPDADFADALTVTASTVGQAGSAATLLTANPCWVLLQGVTLAPGQTLSVTTVVALGDLLGQAGQGATAEFAIGVALSSASAALPPTHCGMADSTIPGTPRSSSPRLGQPAIVEGSTAEASVTPPAEADAEDLPVLNLPGVLGIDPNTWRLFEEYFVLLLLGAFITGTAWFAFGAWRRRKNQPQSDEGESSG